MYSNQANTILYRKTEISIAELTNDLISQISYFWKCPMLAIFIENIKSPIKYLIVWYMVEDENVSSAQFLIFFHLKALEGIVLEIFSFWN